MSSAKDKTCETGVVTVRPATRDDMKHVLDMIKELAEYEGVSDGLPITVDVVTVYDNRMIQQTTPLLCGANEITQTLADIWEEVLYVMMAVRDKVTRIDWHVLENNAPALGFYTKLGARDLRVSEGRTAMRLDEPFIKQLSFEH